MLVYCLPYALAVPVVDTLIAGGSLGGVWELTPPTDAAWAMDGACREMKCREYERLASEVLRCTGFCVGCGTLMDGAGS